MAPEFISKIDPTGAGDYTTLVAWEAARRGDLVARNTIEVAEVYGGGSVRGVLLSAVDWNVDSTHFPWIRAATGHSHRGKYSTATAYLQDEHASRPAVFNCGVGWTRLGPGLILEATSSLAQWFSEYMGSFVTSIPAAQPVIMDGCIFRRTVWTTVGVISIYRSTLETELIIKNCVILHTCVGDGNWMPAVAVQSGKGHIKIYNSLVIAGNNVANPGGGCIGLSIWFGASPGATIESENCYLHSYGAPGAPVYIAGGTTPGANDATSNAEAVTPALRNIPYSIANFENVTIGSEDLHLVTGSSLIGAGADLSGVGVTSDFEGNPRVVPYDVGADAAPASGLSPALCLFGM